MEILQTAIEEKEKRVMKPELHNQAYVDRIYDEIETLRSVVAEIYDTERRRQFIEAQQEKKGPEDTKPKHYKINVVT